MKIAYVSLGCPKNEVDLEVILTGLGDGVEVVDGVEGADAVIVNTCAFIESARTESIEAIFELIRHKRVRPGFGVLVTGCLPQRYREELAGALPEADAFFADRDAAVTADRIRRYLGLQWGGPIRRRRFTPPHYAYICIADGCDNRCSYCAIPLIKGPYRSRPLPQIIDEARQRVEDGARELILVAQDTSYYGGEGGGRRSLPELLAALDAIPGLRWIRLLYTHPAHWDDALIEAVAGLEKVVKYVDLPVQHISERILRQMGRGIGPPQIRELVGRLRRRIPELALRSSVIVGFPGESDDEFAELARFVAETRFERLGAFRYSHEEGTRASDLQDDVPERIKTERQEELSNIQAEISAEINRRFVGLTIEVLFDGQDQEGAGSVGRSAWDAPEIDHSVIVDSVISAGDFRLVQVFDADIDRLFGRVKEK